MFTHFFPIQKAFVENVLLNLVEKTMVMYVQLALASCLLAIRTFDLWMLKGVHDIFVVNVNFISNNQETNHLTIGLFEVIKTSGITMVLKLQELLDRFTFMEKIVAYVKDEGSNLQTCASVFNSIVSCGNLGSLEPFDGSCFGHELSKVC